MYKLEKEYIHRLILKKLSAKRRRERNKNINLLQYDEKRKEMKIARLEKELDREIKLLDKIRKKIALLKNP